MSPFQWKAADIYWTPNGYVLKVPTHLDARACALLEASSMSLQAIAGYTLTPGTPGELEVVYEDWPDVAPEALREVLDRHGIKARRDAKRDDEADTKRAKTFLRGLRGETS